MGKLSDLDWREVDGDYVTKYGEPVKVVYSDGNGGSSSGAPGGLRIEALFFRADGPWSARYYVATDEQRANGDAG